jgi:hypothetical protein
MTMLRHYTVEETAQAYIEMAQDAVDRDDIRIAKLKRECEQRLSAERRLRAAGQVEILKLRRRVAELEHRLDQVSAAGAAFTKAVRASRG